MKVDIIIVSDYIFDSIEPLPFSGYIAILGDHIYEVKKSKDFQHLVGPHTIVKEVPNQLVMAGFQDSHTHLIMAGMFQTYVNLLYAKSEEEAARMVKEHVDAHPNEDFWILGFSWYHIFWNNQKHPTKASLDRYFPDRPVCLVNAEAHGIWVNSKALEISGITSSTTAPYGGFIEKDSNGDPTGYLGESAIGLVGKYAFDLSESQEKTLLCNFMEDAKQKGITSIIDVQPYFHGNMGNIETYHSLDKAKQLTVRLHVAPDLLGNLEEIEEIRDKYHSNQLQITLLKQFLDGVSTAHTALLIDEYADKPGEFGTSLIDISKIEEAIPNAHKKGFSIKLHACGDYSARLALDFYEKSIKIYGKNGCRHAIEHLEIVSSDDFPRFKELGIIPSVQPEHIALTQTFDENPYPIVLGKERANATWPLKTLYEQAGLLAIGSDCPVVDNNPFLEIYRGITRLHNDKMPKGGWNPKEKLSMYQVLRSYTYGGAYSVKREDDLGTLEAGKLADVICIDKNLFDIPDEEILTAKVTTTIMNGTFIYEA